MKKHEPAHLLRWQVLTVLLMVVGYAGYYLCRSDFSVALPSIIDGIGYLGGYLAGDSVARIVKYFGWPGAFTTLAGVAALSSIAAVLYLVNQRRAPVLAAASEQP